MLYLPESTMPLLLYRRKFHLQHILKLIDLLIEFEVESFFSILDCVHVVILLLIHMRYRLACFGIRLMLS